MKKNLLAVAALALTTLTSAFAAAPTGNIYAITPIDPVSEYQTGDTVSFRVRLLAGDYAAGDSAPTAWSWRYVGVAGEKYDEWYNRPRLGIVVSGKLRYAEIVRLEHPQIEIGDGKTANPYTDLICEYRVGPGEIALPVKLALSGSTETNPIAVGEGTTDATAPSQEYLLDGRGIWELWGKNEARADVKASFYFCGASTEADIPTAFRAQVGSRVADYDLTQANFRVKSVDFDQNTEERYWRKVREGDTATLKYQPRIETIGTLTSADSSQLLYVWSADDSAVRVVGTSQTFAVGGENWTRNVATVKLVPGKTTYDFDLEGVTKGKSTTIYLSPTLGIKTDAAGQNLQSYLTREVYCDEPPPPSVEVCFDPASPKASKVQEVDTPTNPFDGKLPIYVKLTAPSETPVIVQLKVENAGNPACDPVTNLNVAVRKSGSAFVPTAETYTNLVFAANQTEQIVWLYPLGGDSDTAAAGIAFTPVLTVPAPQPAYGIGDPAMLMIRAVHDPVVVSPADGADVGMVSPRGFDLPVQVADCYRDLASGKGFSVEVRYNDGNTMTTNVRFISGSKVKIPLSRYSLKATQATIAITDPDETGTAEFKVNFSVTPPKTVTAELCTADGEPLGTTITEGAEAYVRFRVSEPVVSTLYAFLKPVDDTTERLVSTALTTKPQAITPEDGTNVVWNKKMPIKFLDGCEATEMPNGVAFEIELRTERTATDGSVDTVYTPIPFEFAVDNVPPTTETVYIGEEMAEAANDPEFANGAAVTIPCEVDTELMVKLREPGALDLNAGVKTVVRWTIDEGMKVWTKNPIIKTAGGTTGDVLSLILGKDDFANPDRDHKVTIITIDKDELAAHPLTDADFEGNVWKVKYPNAQTYNFLLHVATKPHVTVQTVGFIDGRYGPTMDERGNDRMAKLRVMIDEPAEEDLTVRITAEPKSNLANYGKLPFEHGTVTNPDQSVYVDLVIRKGAVEPNDDYYQNGIKFDYDNLDGTDYSFNDGWKISAAITTDCAKGKDYFKPYSGLWIYVENIAPTIVPGQPEYISTNFNQQVNNEFKIADWRLRDVAADFAYEWPGSTAENPQKGLKVQWYVNDVPYNSDRNAAYVDAADTPQTAWLKLSDEGFSEVRLEVSDKDSDGENGVARRRWYFFIKPQKKLSITPVGGGTTSSKYSKGARGLGEGEVSAEGGGNPVVSGLTKTWSYRVDTAEAIAHATGHKADVANNQADNFFYRWVYNLPAENGGPMQVVLGSIDPKPQPDTEVREIVALDPYEENKTSYSGRYVEAIFSREYLATDNMGDINADGVPDLYVDAYGLLGDSAGAGGEGAADVNDLVNLANGNPDNDMLPGDVLGVTSSFVPGLSNSWSRAFTTRMEIRGAGEHFNNAPSIIRLQGVKSDIRYTDPENDPESTLTDLEYIAFTNWCGRTAGGDANVYAALVGGTGWSQWSPENPTSPTEADTDGDGLPDGYEFYYWYKAFVGSVERDASGKARPETYRQMTGRRYNPLDPCNPTVLTSEYIYNRYNPNVPLDGFDGAVDTDNDGLTDLEELLAGTNPFDYDTDGDGLPDGYELFVSETNPLRGDSGSNADGDQMAKTSLPLYRVRYTQHAGNALTTNSLWAAARPEVETDPATGAMKIVTPVDVYATFTYSVQGDGLPTQVLSRKIADGAAEQGAFDASLANYTIIEAFDEPTPIDVLHFHVYALKGFDPRCAWNVVQAPNTPIAHRVDTAEFTAYDEFMTMSYFLNVGALGEADVTPSATRTIVDIWRLFTTDPANADTDGDGIPDGWELYVMGGGEMTCGSPTKSKHSPLAKIVEDADRDGLTYLEEFCGIESCARYASCETISNVHPDWKNKYWPTDPFNSDTDGDGIPDGEEYTCIYGDAPESLVYSGSVQGGGLNPNSWDTDLDGLPDAWELEFMGTAVTSVEQVAEGATNATETVTAPHMEKGMDPTVADAKLDYDHDGLANWQEYMVGAMRCWRYDDTTTPWVEMGLTDEVVQANAENDEFWGHILVDPADPVDPIPAYNPALRRTGVSPMAYFSGCRNKFDLAQGRFYMLKDGIYHDLRDNQVNGVNRWTAKCIGAAFSVVNSQGQAIYPLTYISCDPRLADTDGDGMDDYYELYHGLNPLLGASGGSDDPDLATGTVGPRDVIFQAYGGGKGVLPWSGEQNYWYGGLIGGNTPTISKSNGPKTANSDLDFVEYPWLAGLPTADPDGDNIRNYQESLMAGVQATSTYLHTDPTPLWMTDFSYEYSLVRRFYTQGTGEVFGFSHPTGEFTYGGKTYRFEDFAGMKYAADAGLVSFTFSLGDWDCQGSQFDFEENEGYDTDHDYLSDFEEGQGKTKPTSSAQDFDDPVRHQAMWFNGTDAFLQTPLAVHRESGTSPEEIDQPFFFYTAEAWVKPDESMLKPDGGLSTVIERVLYNGPAGGADEKYVRKNFLIGVNKGHWYTKFDSSGTDEKQSVEIANGPEATTDWAHVVATYGPANDDEKDMTTEMALRLYVNGKMVGEVKTGLAPEHWNSPSVMIIPGKDLVSFVIGASAESLKAIATIDMGAKIDDYDHFFKGYIDEVRVWDGARKAADIEADYKSRTRYTADLVAANREAVYEAWVEGARRDPTSETDLVLPPELLYHWSFDHLPGAVDAADLIKVPAGFSDDPTVTSPTATDVKARWMRPTDYVCAWWDAVELKSTVYTETSWVPWIANTWGHLPCFDGTTADSVYWSEDYAGDEPAAAKGFAKYGFPRKAEPASRATQQTYLTGKPAITATRWNLVGEDPDLSKAFKFANRNRQLEGYDLLPMGGAFPKRISLAEGGMWDDGSSADAWAQTGADLDNDGLPDWWERIAGSEYAITPPPLNWDTFVEYNGETIPAWQAYLRDLAAGMLPNSNGETDLKFADTRDTDKDGLPDWWENMYGVNKNLASDGEDDPDGDGLSNSAEFIISEIFKYANCKPTATRTDGKTVDAYRKVGDVYLGEIFSDHDRMTDAWERRWADPNAINPYVYDPDADPDGDGWSNYAEFRANTDPTRVESVSIDGYSTVDHPVPVVRANVIYHGTSPILKPLVFKAWNERYDADMVKIPDAVWTVGTAVSEEGGNDDENQAAGSANVVREKREKFIGRKPMGKQTYYLGGGKVTEGSFKLLSLDKGFAIYTINAIGQVVSVEPGEPDEAQWVYHVYDNNGDLLLLGSSIRNDSAALKVGTINYTTGEVTIDFDSPAMNGYTRHEIVSEEGSKDDAAEEGLKKYEIANLANGYFRFEWESARISTQVTGVHILSDAELPSENAKSRGYLREGKNTFICFVDDDDNGEYTPGELFGVVRGVDVGWSGAKFDVELTVANPIFGRIDLKTGANDREFWYGIDSGNITNMVNGASGSSSSSDGTSEDNSTSVDTSLGGGRLQHVRIDRYAVNGVRLGNRTDEVNIPSIGESNQILDKWLDLSVRSYLHEGDILSEDIFDLDWKNFDKEISKSKIVQAKFNGDVTSVSYRIVIDNELLMHPSLSNRVLNVAFTRSFDGNAHRKIPQGLKPMTVYTARPTFRWTMNGYNTYTAYKLRILAEDGKTVIYESPMTRAPATDAEGYYVCEAPFAIGDQTPQGKILAPGANYKWTVSMYNAKFQTDAYATPATFTTSVNQQQPVDDHGFGTLQASVKYAGPAAVLGSCDNIAQTKGIVRVQAFERADFAGIPAASAIVADRSQIAGVDGEKSNVTLVGLTPGVYYVRAFVDSDGDFELDPWESWGAAAEPVTVGSHAGEIVPSAAVYIDDSDTDGDWLPDAWEYVTYGNLDTVNEVVDPDGKIVLKSEVLDSVENGNGSVMTKFLQGSSLTFFRNIETARLLLGLSAGGTDAETVAALREALAEKIAAGTLSITGLRYDAGEGKVVLSVEGKVTQSAGARLLSPMYVIPSLTQVDVVVYRKATLAEAGWTRVNTYTVPVNAALDAEIEVPVEEDLSSGFYKVEVVQ